MWAKTGGIWVSRETIRSRVIPGQIIPVRCALGERLQTLELGTRVRAKRSSKPARGTTMPFRKTSFCPRKISWEHPEPWRVPLRKTSWFSPSVAARNALKFSPPHVSSPNHLIPQAEEVKKINKSHFNGLQQNFKNHFKTETWIFFTLDLLGPQHTLVPL